MKNTLIVNKSAMQNNPQNNQNFNAIKKKHKITVFSKHLHWLNYKRMAEVAVEIGFDGIDLTVRPDGHVSPEKVEEQLPAAVEACKKAGIEILMLCTSIQDIEDPATEKIIKTASQLGIKYYRMGWYNYDPVLDIDKNLDNFRMKMQDLAEMNKQYKIKGSYQNHNGTWFGAPVWDLGVNLRKINSEWLGIQYDILNATIESTSSWSLGMHWLSRYIHTIDIKDAIWFKKKNKWHVDYCPLGKGNVDYKMFISQFYELNIDVPFSMHFEYDLGGADTGAKELSISGSKVIKSMRMDLQLFKTMLDL